MSAPPVAGEGLRFSLPPGWTLGSKDPSTEQAIVEFVKEGETVEAWTELVTVLQFRRARREHSPQEVVELYRKTLEQRCPGVTVWPPLERDEASPLYEFRTMGVCDGQPPQSELGRFLFGDENWYRISYTSRVEFTEDTRATWIAWLREAAVGQGPDITALWQIPPSRIREEVIAEASEASEVVGFRVDAASDSEPHIGWLEKTNAGRTVVLDGRQIGGPYDEVKWLAFEAGRLTWLAKRKSKWLLAADGVELASNYSKITTPGSTAAGRLAAGVCRDHQCRLFLDGRETGPVFQDIGAPDFSPDGQHYVYFGKRQKKWVALVDGTETGSAFDGYSGHRWAKGSRIAVAAHQGKKSTWIVDGNSGPLFDVIGEIAFSRDAQHFAYGAANATFGIKDKEVVGVMVVDGTPLAQTYAGKGMLGAWTLLFHTHQSIAPGLKTLSPDFHGVSDPDFTAAGELVFGRRLAEGGVTVQVGERSGPTFEDIVSRLSVNPDGEHLAYVAEAADMFVEVRDQRPGLVFYAKRDVSVVPWIAQTETGKLIYELVRGGPEFKAGRTQRALRRIVVEGRASSEYDALGIDCKWSDGDRHHACIIVGADETRDRLFLDGLESTLYDDISWWSITFPENAAVQFVARQGRRFLRVKIASLSST